MADLNEFQSKIGYTFKNRHLLEQALTHSSYANEKHMNCLLYTSDAADEEDSVDFGGRRTIKKKKKEAVGGRRQPREGNETCSRVNRTEHVD